MRPGQRSVDLWSGDKHNDGLWLDVSRDGKRLTVTDGRTAIHYALPSGRRLSEGH